MANFDSKKKKEGEIKKRWEKILELSIYTGLYDLSTGKCYRSSQFLPVFKSELSKEVDMFRVKDTDPPEYVYVPFLRLLDDKASCTIMSKE